MNLPKVVIFMSVKDVVAAVLCNNYGGRGRYERITGHTRVMRENGVSPKAGRLGQLQVDLVAAQTTVLHTKRFTYGYIKAVRKVVKLRSLVEVEAAKKANLTASDVRQALFKAQVKVDLLLDTWCSNKGYADIKNKKAEVEAALQSIGGFQSLPPKEHAALYDLAYETERWTDQRLDMLLFRGNCLFKLVRRPGLSPQQQDAVCVLRHMPLSEWLNGEASSLMHEYGLVVR